MLILFLPHELYLTFSSILDFGSQTSIPRIAMHLVDSHGPCHQPLPPSRSPHPARTHLVDRAVVDEDGQGQLVLILRDVSPSSQEGIAHANPDLLGVKELVLCQFLPLQTCLGPQG